MRKVTIGYGATLLTLGVGGFLGTGSKHKTALIPAGFGAAALGLGIAAGWPGLRRAALCGAALVSGLGLAGSARGLRRLPALLRGEEVERPAAVISQSSMALLSALHLACSLSSRCGARG
jgi:hypothetical protein